MNVTAYRSASAGAIPAAVMASPLVSKGHAASLLPDTPSPGPGDVEDAMSVMYELVAKQGDVSVATGEMEVNTQNREQETEAQTEETALKKEEADEAKMSAGGGLFGEICHMFCDVGKDLAEGRLAELPVVTTKDAVNILDNPNLVAQLEAIAPEVAEYVGIAAAVIGAAALTVASGGVGGVAVAAVVIALSASGMLVSKTHCLGKYSADIGLGLEVASAVVSCGASAGTAAGGALQTASSIAQGASGGADVLAGASTILVGKEQADVTDDSADVQQALALMNRNARLVADLVAGLKDAQTSNSNTLQTLASASHTSGQTLTVASAMKA